MISVVILFLGLSLLFYVLFAGADFGAGILEIFTERTRADERAIISHAIGPVWEANHVWIILVIVLLFTGFPSTFISLVVPFHLPLLVMLLGITLRGCAFTFRQYDAIKDHSHVYYSAIFQISSLLTPLVQGIIAGGIILGQFHTDSTDFTERFILPWANVFSLVVGLFLCCMNAFLAACYLIGETQDAMLRERFYVKANYSAACMAIAGALVFLSAYNHGLPLFEAFFSDTMSTSTFIISSILLCILCYRLRTLPTSAVRLFAACIVTSVLVAFLFVKHPGSQTGLSRQFMQLNLYETAAPAQTMQQLVIALCVGSMLIFPTLFWLLKTFKTKL